VREDFLKFIPFSFFLIVPGMELLLPAWLMVFPNSKPSQWSSEAEQQAKFVETKAKKHAAAAKLMGKIPKMLS
jgi:LETM1 and EF-hand domain-containing protein 1